MPTGALPCACTTLRKASRAVTRLYDEALRPTRVTTTQFAVMRAVARAGTIPMSHVARAMVMDRTTLYRTVTPLLRAGDLVSVPSEEDRRVKSLRLSPSGRRRMARAERHWAQAQRRMVESMGSARWERLSRGLREVTDQALALAGASPEGGVS